MTAIEIHYGCDKSHSCTGSLARPFSRSSHRSLPRAARCRSRPVVARICGSEARHSRFQGVAGMCIVFTDPGSLMSRVAYRLDALDPVSALHFAGIALSHWFPYGRILDNTAWISPARPRLLKSRRAGSAWNKEAEAVIFFRGPLGSHMPFEEATDLHAACCS